jgi:hypothetical protein
VRFGASGDGAGGWEAIGWHQVRRLLRLPGDPFTPECA